MVMLNSTDTKPAMSFLLHMLTTATARKKLIVIHASVHDGSLHFEVYCSRNLQITVHGARWLDITIDITLFVVNFFGLFICSFCQGRDFVVAELVGSHGDWSDRISSSRKDSSSLSTTPAGLSGKRTEATSCISSLTWTFHWVRPLC